MTNAKLFYALALGVLAFAFLQYETKKKSVVGRWPAVFVSLRIFLTFFAAYFAAMELCYLLSMILIRNMAGEASIENAMRLIMTVVKTGMAATAVLWLPATLLWKIPVWKEGQKKNYTVMDIAGIVFLLAAFITYLVLVFGIQASPLYYRYETTLNSGSICLSLLTGKTREAVSAPVFTLIIFRLLVRREDEMRWKKRPAAEWISVVCILLFTFLCIVPHCAEGLLLDSWNMTVLESRSFSLSKDLVRFVGQLSSFPLYYFLVWLCTPLLRKRVSATGCATFWIVPSFVSPIFLRIVDVEPLIYLPTTRVLAAVMTITWFFGFLVSLSIKIVRHCRYRNAVLKNAVTIDDRTLRILCKERMELGLPGKGEVVFSPAVKTPVSVGVGNPITVLPLDRGYTDEELRLILRHELIHLAHRDNQIKLFMVFVSSGVWFLPPRWLGLETASEDLELSCDEKTVEGMDAEGVKRYAELILDNAEPAAGFNTCLCATVEGLRYRLHRLTHPKKRSSGAGIAFLLVVLLTFSAGTVGFSYGSSSVSDLLETGGDWGDRIVMELPIGSTLTNIGQYSYWKYPCEYPQHLMSALSELTVREIDSEKWSDFNDTKNGTIITDTYVWITFNNLTIYTPGDGTTYVFSNGRTYITDQSVDMQYLRSMAGQPLSSEEAYHKSWP